MRSAVANHLCNGHSQRDPDKEFIKDFENSLFRLIMVSDSNSFTPILYRSKIATICETSGTKIIKWKASRINNSEKFNSDGFDTSFESPEVNSILQLRISINQTFIKKFRDQLTGLHERAVDFIMQDDILPSFLQVLHQYTLKYLTREIHWFNKFPGNQSNTVIKTVERLKQTTAKQDQYLLHLGFGSGFHAMTGDWQYDDHTNTGIWNGGFNHGKPKYKTRRIAFDRWPNPLYFGPMGFALLSLNPFSESEGVIKNQITPEVSTPEQPKPELKPVHRKGPVKNGTRLDGVVKENKMVDVYMPNGTIKTVSLVSGSADPGRIIVVAVYPDKKGNFTQASFADYKR